MVAVICKRPMMGTWAFGNHIIKTHMGHQYVEATGEYVSQQWLEWM